MADVDRSIGVSTGTRLNDFAGNNQLVPVVTAVSDGLVVAWYGYGASAGQEGWGIWGQYLDARGAQNGPDFSIAFFGAAPTFRTTAHGTPYGLELQSLPDGGFVVAWFESGTNNYPLRAWRYDSAGNRAPSPGGNDGAYLIDIWQSDAYGIQQAVNPNDLIPANAVWSKGLIDDLSITALPNGDLVFAISVGYSMGPLLSPTYDDGLYMTRYDRSMNLVPIQEIYSPYTFTTAIDAFDDGRFAVAMDLDNDIHLGVYRQDALIRYAGFTDFSGYTNGDIDDLIVTLEGKVIVAASPIGSSIASPAKITVFSEQGRLETSFALPDATGHIKLLELQGERFLALWTIGDYLGETGIRTGIYDYAGNLYGDIATVKAPNFGEFLGEPSVAASGGGSVFVTYAMRDITLADSSWNVVGQVLDLQLADTGSGDGAGTPRIFRASTASTGAQANDDSSFAAISADGRYVAFSSQATNLVPGDTNAVSDVFVKDLQTGVLTRTSTGSNGAQGNSDWTGRPSISADGRYVAFETAASSLVLGDTNGASDIFVKDLQTGTLTRASTASNGTQGDGWSSNPSISADGRYVAFASDASNLVPDDTNAAYDIFVKDLQTGLLTRVSKTSNGTQGDYGSWNPAISANGRYVAFESSASILVPGDTNDAPDIFVKDLQTGTLARVSVTSNGIQGNGDSLSPTISADGRFVAFVSADESLVRGDTNAASDIFVKDLQTGSLSRVSTASDGTQANDWSWMPSISADGRYVAFSSDASNLVPDDNNAKEDVFLKDIATGALVRVSTGSDGSAGNGYSAGSSISADGRYVTFFSLASNLIAGDTNGAGDVFVFDRDAGQVSLEPPSSFKLLDASRVGPTANELPVEMIKFAITAYFDTHHGADATADPDAQWSPVTALQVSGANFGNGVYADYEGRAVAHLYVGDVGGTRTLVVAFRGTDDLPSDFPDYAEACRPHWNRFAPLIDVLGSYIDQNNIDSVNVTGHSLGGAMVEYFLASFSNLGGVDYKGFTFGSPGGGRNNGSEARLHNYEHDEPIPKVGALAGAMSSGWIVSIGWDLPNELTVTSRLPPLGHASATYLESMRALFSEGENLLPSSNVTLLRDLTTVASIEGTSASNVLVGDSRSELLLGFGGDDILTGGGGNDILDGGDGTDTASYLSSYATYLLQKQAAENLLYPKLSLPGSLRPQSIKFAQASAEASAVPEEGTDRLISIERLQFADKTFDLVNLPRQGVPAYGKQNGFLFDAVFYLLDNAELVPTQTLATALQHYFSTGAAQGKQPNSWFDPTYYENRWPDLKAGNFSDDILFMHYNLYGVWEGRSAGPKFDKFDGNRYLADNPDVAAYVDAYVADFLGSRSNGAIAHYVIYGQHEQRLAFDLVGQQIDLGYTVDLGG